MIVKNITIFWFRCDLRLSDNPGLFAAAVNENCLPIYVLENNHAVSEAMGSASRCWLHHSLTALDCSLDKRLNIFQGDAKEVLSSLIDKLPIKAVYWNRGYEPSRMRIDSEIEKILEKKEIECKSFSASLLWEPWTVLKEDGTPYKVFTPFYKRCLTRDKQRNLSEPANLRNCVSKSGLSLSIKDLKLLPYHNWHVAMISHWTIGESAALKKLDAFIENSLPEYKGGRDFPAQRATSYLSPHLHFGEISPNQIVNKVHSLSNYSDSEHFLRELGWREFSYHLLYHFPDIPESNFQEKFDLFPWKSPSKKMLKAWQKGYTGYPIVDAGMRELWQTGYMHNRVRMVVASFLVKNLLFHWHHGRDWFWDCLVDADLANNSASWQWVAGSGADAAPYFRVFNPILQGEKFDPNGEYTRRYVPELERLPNKYLFKPWEAPNTILKAAGVELGTTYPKPIVNLMESRNDALTAFKFLKGEESPKSLTL
eukprot:GHVL01023540.1.p1 GENE.GHVL01023540.1~~GHVL01023540.1.p1  ORF type:complete len:482 (+),score=58.83 GHVL01023540.1:61-1506(+)